MTAIKNYSETLAEVLGPLALNPHLEPQYYARALKIEQGSDQERLIARAAAQIRRAHDSGIARTGGSEDFFTECVLTHLAVTSGAHPLDQDRRLADIAYTVGLRAMVNLRIKPTTEAAKAEMRRIALSAAQTFRSLFAEQLMLEAA